MKSLIFWLSCAACLLIIVGCRKPELSREQTTNSQFNVELLFEHDGVKVYRFFDGRAIYYTDARGKTAWDETHSNGKSSYTEHLDVETAQ